MIKKLYPDEIKRLESSLKTINKGLETLNTKKKRLLEQLGTEKEVVEDTLVLDDGKYKILGTFYKCQKYKNDGELGGQTRYIEVNK